MFKPSETRPGDVPGKWEEDALEGVFAGYEMAPGYTWTKRYLVWAVTDFDGLNLRKNVIAEEFSIREPFSVARLVVPAGQWTFPLKSKYDRINYQVEGEVERASGETQLFVAPPNVDVELQELQQQGEVQNYAVDNIPRYEEDPIEGGDDDDLGVDIADDEAETTAVTGGGGNDNVEADEPKMCENPGASSGGGAGENLGRDPGASTKGARG